MRLAAALADDSQLVLLDEPTNHLDSDSVEELIRLFIKVSAHISLFRMIDISLIGRQMLFLRLNTAN